MKKSNEKFGYSNFLRSIDVSLFRKLYLGGIVFGLFIRIFFALTATGIYHPDEIFQSLEMAHYLVYGYGAIPPEFSLSNPYTPSYAKARSWIIPLIISIFIFIGDFLNFPYWSVTLPLVRFMMGVNSFLLIPATRRLGENISGDQKIGYLSGFFVAIWWKIAYITTRPLFNVFFLPIFIYAIALFYRRRFHSSETDLSAKEWIVYFLGFGVATYVRIDFLIVLFAFAIVHLIYDFYEGEKKKFINDLSVLVLPSVLGWIIGMGIDAFMYEGIRDFGIVPVRWFMFNIIEGRSDDFGVLPLGWYAYRLIIQNGLTTVSLLMVIFFFFIVHIFFQRRELISVLFPNERLLKEFTRLFLSLLLAWFIYETPWRSGFAFWNSVSHKEERFVMNLYVIYFVSLAIFVFVFAEFAENVMTKQKPKIKKSYPRKISPQGIYNAIVFTIIFLVTISSIFHMAFTPVFQFGSDINSSISYVGKQEDLEGVMIVEKWYLTGAYTYLHQDVPIYWVNSTSIYEIIIGFNQGIYNYLILPKYKYYEIPNLIETIIADGWVIHKVVDGKTEIWFKA